MIAVDESVVEKTAKKLLKKQGEMKVKALSKAVVAKLGDDKVTVKQVKKTIKRSFSITEDGKSVTLLGPAEKKIKTSSDKSTTDTNNNNSNTNIQDWRKEHKIIVMHASDDEQEKSKQLVLDSTYFPYSSFDECKKVFTPSLIKQCTEGNNFKRPSPIQAQSWPILCQQRDLVGIAETGSGKTLAFAMPALTRWAITDNNKSGSNNNRQPRMLVLSPTRELAMQSAVVLEEFGAVVGLQSLVVYGGVPKYTQVSELKRGVDCLVATPGRLQDLLQDKAVRLDKIEYLVLDEADRMLDMGFEEEVRKILKHCTMPNRQTAMFSATWPAVIQNIAMEFMNDPIRVYVGFDSIIGKDGTVDDSLSANKRVTQYVEVIEDRQRDGRLRQLLEQVHDGKNRVLIFALYKKEAERLEFALSRNGYNCGSIHGNKHQQQRSLALANFKDGSCPLLVATDVAARGLDIPNVEVVINYTFPLTIEDYVHRIGRTGRAGKTGVSYTFFQPGDKTHAGELQQVLRSADQEVPEDLLKFGSTIKKKEHKLYGNFGPKGIMKKATKIVFD